MIISTNDLSRSYFCLTICLSVCISGFPVPFTRYLLSCPCLVPLSRALVPYPCPVPLFPALAPCTCHVSLPCPFTPCMLMSRALISCPCSVPLSRTLSSCQSPCPRPVLSPYVSTLVVKNCMLVLAEALVWTDKTHGLRRADVN